MNIFFDMFFDFIIFVINNNILNKIFYRISKITFFKFFFIYFNIEKSFYI